ncbi:carbohydrate ABC transporter permease [Mumia zhuanghuii]|uniref:Sugar ABC transporter permease n=1 Tax=Mumia zhuanghuii TaxID=2585211 RepID=A0A5C4MH97_9ACTN|nr:sugar ABC transporter permease [Mumia zhuanghuii]TNC43628.1 sugar ABC transporter permease [Mumia zhuanghuii]TNC46658.1 sugar ABC transporter permease [Mumia zhuanghuii]
MHLRDRLARLDISGAPYLFIAPFFVLFGIFGLFPLGYTLWVSLHDWSLLGGNEGWVGFANYRELVTDEYFWNSLLNTFGIFVLATIPQIIAALALAQVLNTSLRSLTFWRVGVIIPTATSIAAVGIIFTMMFSSDFGIINWLLGLVGIEPVAWNQERLPSWLAIATMVDWRWTGYNALILLAALQAVPKELYESARLDGASAVRQFRSITIPMLRPTLMFVVTVATIGGIQLFTEPLLFNPGANAITGGDTRQFQTSAMYVVEQAFSGQRFGYAATVAWILFAIIVVVSLVNSLLVRRIRSVD